jgi:hypothetical protein
VRMILREGLERLPLVVERGDEGVRHRAGDREAELTRGLDVRGRLEADDRAPPGRGPGRLDPVRPPEREVDQPPAFRRDHVAGGLGRERGVKRHLVQQDRLDQLGLGDRCRHLEDRFLRVNDAALRHRPYLAPEADVAEIVDRALVEPDLAEVREVLLVERERLEELQAMLQTRRDEEAPLLRHVPHVEAEGRRTFHPTTQVARRHVEFVEVGAQPAGHAT